MKRLSIRKQLISLITTLLLSTTTLANSSDTIYQGGDILTMNQKTPNVEAVGVRDGKIFIVGTKEKVGKAMDATAKKVDLQGKTLMPSFFEPHGHLLLTTMLNSYANLNAPPVGNVDSIKELKQRLRNYASSHNLKPDDWIVGINYDDSAMIDHRQPTRQDLDEVSKTNPIFILHSSDHMGVANSKALEIAGITSKTKNPAGGSYLRDSKGLLTGVLVENTAYLTVMKHITLPTEDAAIKAFHKTLLEQYAAKGITTAQEAGGAFPVFVEVMRKAGSQGKLPIDVLAYPKAEDSKVLDNYATDKKYKNNFRLGGLKIILDGSLQLRTGYLSKSYYTMPKKKNDANSKNQATKSHHNFAAKTKLLLGADVKGHHEDIKNDDDKKKITYRGYPNYTQKELDTMVANALSKGWHLMVHCNGDGAVDMTIESMKKALKVNPVKDHRTTIIHAQTIREDQLDDVKKLGIALSLFPNHIYYWGDRHSKEFLGPKRAARMNPMHSTVKRGISYTIHTDTPVTPSSLLNAVGIATNRVSSGGLVMDKDQELSIEEALRAITINAAWQQGEEKSKGSLEKGKRADLVILAQNPLKTQKTKIKDIKVLETIKDGKTVYLNSN